MPIMEGDKQHAAPFKFSVKNFSPIYLAIFLSQFKVEQQK
jgi:hypothetical protein